MISSDRNRSRCLVKLSESRNSSIEDTGFDVMKKEEDETGEGEVGEVAKEGSIAVVSVCEVEAVV